MSHRYKQGTDEDGKKTSSLEGTSSPVYPPKPLLDPTLLPSLDLTMPQATQAIMRNAAAKPTQEYIKLWKECKTAGVIDTVKILEQQTGLITSDTTIYDILLKMEAIGKMAFEEKRIETRNVTGMYYTYYITVSYIYNFYYYYYMLYTLTLYYVIPYLYHVHIFTIRF